MAPRKKSIGLYIHQKGNVHSSEILVELGLWDSNILRGKLCLYLGERANQTCKPKQRIGGIFRLTTLVAIVRSWGHLYLGERANQTCKPKQRIGGIFRLTTLVAIVRSWGHQYSTWTIYYEFDWLGLLGETDKSCPSGLLNRLPITMFIGNNTWEC